ncbi:MAG: hypothetical protein H8D45_23880 [Bacteroidetes bacterium]|nr:hypothetical protein [Bacteroidota bacterium]MBL7105799.1 hypothetical protein [Bacteroidales bacterium]
MNPKQDKNGFYYYDSQPPDTRVASADDFYNDQMQLIIDKPLLVQSYHNPDIFFALRTKIKFNPGKLQPWLAAGRVFVWDGE